MPTQACCCRCSASIAWDFRDALLGKLILEQQHGDLSTEHELCGVHLGTGVSPLLDDAWHSIRLDGPDGPLPTQHIPGLQLWPQLGFRNSCLDERGKQIPATVSGLCWGWEGFSAHKGKKLNKETPARSHNSRSVAINSGEELDLAPIPAFHGDFQGSSSSLPIQAGLGESLSPQHRVVGPSPAFSGLFGRIPSDFWP